MITQAFVLGAGLGTRLRPLTESLPKPLMPIFGKPLITFALDHLRGIGVESFVINTHHLAAQFESLFVGETYAGHPVRLIHEPDLLETGGGIKNAERWLGTKPFIVYSGDILTDIELEPLIEEHLRAGNDVTLALRETGLATDVALWKGRVVDIQGKYGHAGHYDYANVSVWSPTIFERIPAGKKISFVPILADWIGQNGKIGGVVVNEHQWFNIGSRTEYLAVHRTIAKRRWTPGYVKTPDWPVHVARNAMVDSTARLSGFYSIGANCRVGAEAILEDTILWPGAQIASRSYLRNCIVRSHQRAEGTLHDLDI
jgi:mannose-1-phosphate guanylyltransferase